MFSFNLIYFVILIINLHGGRSEISDKRLCADENCSEPVSLATTLLRYNSLDPRVLSFGPNSPVKVYSKEAGSLLDLWGVEIHGRRGYAPKKMLKEHKILKKATVLVPTELSENTEVPVGLGGQVLKPDRVMEPYEVVDGTTVHLNQDVHILPSSTEGPMLHTATPVGTDPQQLDGEFKVKNTNTVESNKKEEDVQSDIKETSEEKNESAQTETTKENSLKLETGNDQIVEENHSPEKENANTNETDKENVEFKFEDTLKAHHSFKTYGLKTDGNDSVQISNESVTEETDTETPKENINLSPQQEPSEENKSGNVQEETSNVSELESKETDVNSEQISTNPTILSSTETPFNNEIPLPEYDNEAVTPNPKDTEVKEDEQVKDVSNESSDKETGYQMFNESNSGSAKEIENNLPNGNLDLPESSSSINHTQEDTNVPDTSPEVTNDETAHPSTTQRDTEESVQSEQHSPTEETAEPKKSDDNLPSTPSQIIFAGLFPPQAFPASSEDKSNEETLPVNSEDQSNEGTLLAISDDKSNEETLPAISEDKSNEETLSASSYIEDPLPETLPASSEDKSNEELLQETLPVSSEDKSSEEPLQETLNENSSDEIKDEEINEGTVEEKAGFFDSFLSFFSYKTEETGLESSFGKYAQPETSYCSVEDTVCNSKEKSGLMQDVLLSLNSDIFLYLLTSAVSCIIFLFLYIAIEKSRREGPLIARINKLEKELIVTIKENDLLKEQTFLSPIEMSDVPNEEFDELKNKLLQRDMLREDLEMQIATLQKEVETKQALEAQVESLEKELETSTEIGMELNKIIAGMLDSTNGSEILKENVEQLQRQLIEQKDIINTISSNLVKKEKENVDLIVEVEANKKKAIDLQTRLDDMVQKILDIQKERDDQLGTLQNDIAMYQSKYNDLSIKNEIFNNEIQKLKLQLSEAKKQLEVKTRECDTIKENINSSPKGELKGIFDAIAMKAEFDQLKAENERYSMDLQRVEADNSIHEKEHQVIMREIEVLRQKYEQADKEKVESNMKLEVLNSYFKKRETELQEEVLKYKAIWDAKEGEATSTTERIKLLQEEIENYKSQNESLKQEILSQEIDLKSKISMLDQKIHENWVQARQTERKMEDAKQEAAQLRKKLTLRERAIAENRLQSPIEQNGDMTFSPHPLESPASPPLLYRTRDHITNSPTLSGLPPFIPPPPGAPFMPPPPIPGMPMPFMPPPPSMYPGDHRPPPLGRMSSPLLNSRYSPDTSAFSPYERNSPSPPYDSEYGASPPPVRAYSPPYNRDRDERREFKRPPPPQQHARSNGRNLKGSIMSSGSDRSNDSLDKINRNQSKMV